MNKLRTRLAIRVIDYGVALMVFAALIYCIEVWSESFGGSLIFLPVAGAGVLWIGRWVLDRTLLDPSLRKGHNP